MEAACLRSPLLAHWAGLLVAACRFLELDCHAAASCDAAWLPLSLAAAVILLAAVAGAAAWRWLAAAQARDGARMVAVAATVLKELRKVAPQQYPAERHMFMPAAEGTLPADPLQPLLCAVCLGELGSAYGGPAPAAQACAACGTLAHDGCVRGASKTCRPLCCGGAAAGHSRQQHFWQAWGTVLDEESAAADGSPTCLYCQEPAETDGLVAAEPLWRCSLCGDACHVSCFAEAHPHLPTVAAKLHTLLSGKKHGSGGSRGQNGQASPQRRQRWRALGGEPGGSAVAGSSPSGGSSDDVCQSGMLSPAAPPADSTPAVTEPSSAVSDRSVAEGVRRRRHGCSGGTPAITSPAAVQAASGGREPAAPQARPRSSSWLQALAGMVSRRSSSSGAGAGTGAAAGSGDGAAGGSLAAAAAVPEDSGYSSDTESEDEFDARLQRQRWRRRRHRRLASQDIGRLDECSLGPNRRSVLPPTAVRLASRSREGSQTGLADEAAAAAPAASGGHAGGGGGGAHAHQAQQADGSTGAAGAAAAAKEPGQGKAAGRDVHKKSSSWWRRLYRKKGLQWSDYRIEQLPPGCKPVLVFVNTKSGPQVGTSLRQRFLRALHPLQVVELPRQKPDAALQLFAPVAAHTRILVVGGDGSVAWVLSTLEGIRASQAAAGNPHWKPPPVAVLPLGTGNDLARCLGWGAGHGMWRQEGLATMLSEVQHAAPLHIDRWNVAFAPPHAEDAPATPRGKLASMLQRGGSLARSGFGHAHHPGGAGSGGDAAAAAAAGGPPPVVKQMNNYLGIGVDAKVALDFHQMREQLPFFFTSQLGNKLWYTTIGGVDIVSGHALGSSACVNLAQKVQVVCDGCPVALPADIEGLLVCNINSYMGGVDLWRNSYSLAGTGMLRRGSGSSSGGGLNGGSHRHAQQSMMDGKVEIVAVYGSWHLGQLQVGLSRAVRLGQGSEVVISTIKPLPMQVDGEPFVQAPCVVHISRRGQGLVLRRVQSKPLAKMMQALSEVLEESEHRGTITPAQHHALMSELSSRLQPLLLHPA